MNALELADLLSEGVVGYKLQFEAADMLRTIPALQAEIEALKMGFANSGTHDSELAETRAMAGRLFLKVQNLEFEQEGYENLTEMLESEKAKLTEKNCQQQAEIETLKALLVKEQDESFDRTASHMAGEYVSYPVKELTLTDAEISDFTHRMVLCCGVHPNSADINVLGLKFIVEEILRKAQE